jgi:hypothetical protein
LVDDNEERIDQDAVDDINPTWPERTYDLFLVYDDAYFATNTPASQVKHWSVMAQLIRAINWPVMTDIVVTLADNFRMSVLTNQRHVEGGGMKRRIGCNLFDNPDSKQKVYKLNWFGRWNLEGRLLCKTVMAQLCTSGPSTMEPYISITRSNYSSYSNPHGGPSILFWSASEILGKQKSNVTVRHLI